MVTRIVLHDRYAWLKNRKAGIGGSDAACIIGLNPWKSNIELWQEKVGLKEKDSIADSEAVKYGTDAEPLLRELFRLDFPEYDVEYAENNTWSNDRYPFALASLDGWLTDSNGRKGILEIKTSNILQSMQKEKWHDRIPDNYFCQILHYLAITEFDFVILKAHLRTVLADGNIFIQTKHYRIERSDVEEDISYLMQKEEEFWNENVLKKKQPALILPQI